MGRTLYKYNLMNIFRHNRDSLVQLFLPARLEVDTLVVQ